MNTTRARKDEHIRINLEEDVGFESLHTGFSDYRFIHTALPELDLDAVQTRIAFLGKPLAWPLVIASMTGGSPEAGRINRHLALAAQAAGVGLALGSIRAALEAPDCAWTFQVRHIAPDILLLANLGAVQLNYGHGVAACRRAVELVEADGLILHLNPLQEALQPEGQTHFAGLLAKIEQVCRALAVPVVVKEVGWGLSAQVARQLIEAGVSALDVSGAGGTSWSQVELYRSRDPVRRETAAAFRAWGIPTVEALLQVRAALPDVPLLVGGGVRDGVDVAKALALGGDVASPAGVLLADAVTSAEAVQARLALWERQLQIAMFVAGAGDITALKRLSLYKPCQVSETWQV